MPQHSKINFSNWSETDKPREKLLAQGRSSLSDSELIAILIGSGNRSASAIDLARQLLKYVDNDLSRLAKLNTTEFCKLHGIGKAKAITIIAAMELGRRRMSVKPGKKTQISGSSSAYNHIYPFLADLQHEEFWVIHMNRANYVMATERISSGGISGTVVDIRLLMKSCLEKLSSSIILAHNHPSGNLKASTADIGLTMRIIEGGKILDIKVLDHLIIGENSYLSFLDENII
ncbi:MAG: DNA repair protein RadC [Chitinophagales bacterium]|nr:DNA repair protein RadC [Chitinophagales bacterium]